jgi:hypothetical protein
MWNEATTEKSARAVLLACLVIAAWVSPSAANAQTSTTQPAVTDDSEVRPPMTQADLKIVKRARELLDSPAKWNRADNRKCAEAAKTLSLYCALERATVEIGRTFEHRGAALQEMRFVIDEIAATRNYDHRLMDYNNDPTTSFADVREVLRITESLITLRLKGGDTKTAMPTKP